MNLRKKRTLSHNKLLTEELGLPDSVRYKKSVIKAVPRDKKGRFDPKAFKEYFDKEGMSYLSEVARKCNVSREYVRQVVNKNNLAKKTILGKVYVPNIIYDIIKSP